MILSKLIMEMKTFFPAADFINTILAFCHMTVILFYEEASHDVVITSSKGKCIGWYFPE